MNSSSKLASGYLLRLGSTKDTWAIFHSVYFDNKLTLVSIYYLPLLTYLLVLFTSPDEILKFLALGACSVCISIGISVYFIGLSSIKKRLKTSQCWVIKYHNKIVGFTIVKRAPKYSELSNLYVRIRHRKQGLGSHLVRTVLEEVSKPIYLISTPKALHFYMSLDFLPVPRDKLPKPYSQLSYQGMIVLRFVSKESDTHFIR